MRTQSEITKKCLSALGKSKTVSFEIRLFVKTILSNQQKVLKFGIACCCCCVVFHSQLLLIFSAVFFSSLPPRARLFRQQLNGMRRKNL